MHAPGTRPPGNPGESRNLRPWAASLALLVAALYGPFLGRYFTSEDFLLIRFLREHPPWRDVIAQWTRPWLEVTAVGFYRPLSSAIYSFEAALFGGRSWLYNLAHVAIHVACVLLLWRVAARIAKRLEWPAETAFAGAALFAVYPLHPNAVLFSASFATLFSAAFLLGSLLAWERHAEAAAGSQPWLALVLFALGLASYEAAVVWPFVLLSYDALVRREHFPRVLRRAALFFVGAAAYMAWRGHLFGGLIGGYPGERARLVGLRAVEGAVDLAGSLARLLIPVYSHAWPPAAVAAACSLAGLVTAAALRAGRGGPALWAWSWAVLAMAPFGVRAAVPATGRYWYLAAAGAALAWSFSLAAVATRWPRFRPATLALLAALGILYATLLEGYLFEYRRAGQETRAFQRSVAAAPAARAGDPIVVSGAPPYLLNRASVPIAAVFHWGLRDALGPPFVNGHANVYPAPELDGRSAAALVAAGLKILRWRGDGNLEPLAPSPEPGTLEASAPADGARVAPSSVRFEVAAAPRDGLRYRLMVLAPGNFLSQDIAAPPGAVEITGDVPGEFLQTHARLYGSGHTFYWWIEGRGDAEAVVSVSPVRGFVVELGK
jgi:hypothetical protein